MTPVRSTDERPFAAGGAGAGARPLLAEDRGGFVGRHGLWTDAQYAAAAQLRRVIDETGIELVRFAFADPHGILRGKTVTRSALASALRSGITAPSSLLLKDSSGLSAFPVFSPGAPPGLGAAGDVVLVPDPRTFRVVPWAARTGWVLCDLHFPDGSPVPFCSRGILRGQLAALAGRGYRMTVGAELEFHLFRADPFGAERVGRPGAPGAAPVVRPTTAGAQLLHEEALDGLDDLVQALHHGLTGLDLPLRSLELEFGPSQLELTLEAADAAAAADAVTICRTAVRQIARRLGYLATFMARPQGSAAASSGWHLHQSLTDIATGRPAFMPAPGPPLVGDGQADASERGDGDAARPAVLSPAGQAYLEGILRHAPGATAFATPTVNGYKRFRPHSLAPDRIAWGIDNKGAMVRAVGGPGDPATRLENRSGEPAANPYLYIASQLASGMVGITNDFPLRPPTDDPYGADVSRLPRSLGDAVAALERDQALRAALTPAVIDWYAAIKRSEFDRYLRHVSDWEQREYLGLF
jgi:glutamine synthetase